MKSDSLPTLLQCFNSQEMLLDNIGNEKNFLNLPYKLCAIKGKKLKFLEFWIFDENTNKLHRKRRECPKGENFTKWFKERSIYINDALSSGVRIRKIENPIIIRSIDTYTIIDAFVVVQNLRTIELSENTANRDKSYFKQFFDFLDKQNLKELKLIELQKKHIILYLDILKAEKKLNNLSRNNYLNWIKAILSTLVDREYIKENVCKGIKNLKEEETASIAFTADHQKELKSLLIGEDTELYIFCMCVFYTFVRPIELRRLKVEQVNLTTKKIRIFGIGSKNKKTQYVMIPKPLADILLAHNFLARPADDLLFSSGGNDLKNSRNKFSMNFSKIIAKYKYPKSYSLYCWKHTGVTEFYKTGCGIKFIQMQCRHSSLDETDKYLKSLGLFENDDILNNAPEI